MQHWPLHQLDVNNAFLNGLLSNPVYMEQPPGFIDPRFLHHVCHLQKALYGLKQARLAWFQRFGSFLLHLGFVSSKANPSLFIYHHNTATLYLLVYVNDIILTGSNQFSIQTILAKIRVKFAIKDLGRLSYFLGLEVHYGANSIFLSQAKYTYDILDRANLLDAKPIASPLASGIQLTSTGDPFPDPTLYRSLVGALQYLTITCPDLLYVVNSVSQFLPAPTIDHFQAIKRILRYVKGTLSYGLSFTRGSSLLVLGYSNVEWAHCVETRHSTYGYSIFLEGNLVSWSAKK